MTEFLAEFCAPGLQCTIHEGVVTLMLCRPEKRNALSWEMWHALPGLVRAIDTSPEARVLIITGAGGHFSAGSDIADLNVPLADFWETNATAEEAMAEADIPTIAAITGNCIGGGTELAAACDIRVASLDSSYGITAAKLGVVYPPEPTRRLAQIIGTDWARYLLLTGEIIDAEQAWQRGFIHILSDNAVESAHQLAVKLTTRSALSQSAIQRILAGDRLDPSPGGWLDRAYRAEITAGQQAFFDGTTPDFPHHRTQWQQTAD